jgi:gamma-glutamylaminecyclotransferase
VLARPPEPEPLPIRRAWRILARMAAGRECRLFVYGSLREGEPRHALLKAARLLGVAATPPSFYLVDVGPYAALVRGGTTAVTGEIFLTDLETRRAIDVELQVPILFSRETIQLADGAEADAYLLTSDQVRGRRRIAHGDWKKRFSRGVAPRAGGAWVEWSRGRWTK